VVGVVGRLKKWVKAVSVARKREAFSTAFAHGLRSKFSSCPSTVKAGFRDIEVTASQAA